MTVRAATGAVVTGRLRLFTTSERCTFNTERPRSMNTTPALTATNLLEVTFAGPAPRTKPSKNTAFEQRC
jgi:hypothetical protein